jgi:predicted flavoprotein YhiN
MNISRWISRSASASRLASGQLTLGLSSFEQPAVADRWLLDRTASSPSRTVAALLQEHIPERLAQWWAGQHSAKRLGALDRADRTALAARIAALPLKATGTRGFSFAETTAGGVALEEISHRTMESRIHPGLYLVGEILDADGRIGGFNFQWAWCTGRIAGRDLARRFSGANS